MHGLLFKSQITLPSGAIVEYGIRGNWLYHIYVRPSIFDEDTVEGLCGNPNGKADDFIHQGFLTTNLSSFQASWRYIYRVLHNFKFCSTIEHLQVN